MTVQDVLLYVGRVEPREAVPRFAAAGLPIFPCEQGGKRPLTRAGFLDASTDMEKIDEWWRRWPAANIGLPTGRASGIEVVDVDVKPTGSGFATFNRAAAHGLLDGEIARVRTPSGGMHVYFPVGENAQRSWQSARAHIDFRGEGGYVMVPPSVSAAASGTKTYSPYSLSSATGGSVDALALREFVDPRPTRSSQSENRVVSVDVLSQWVSRLSEGERNHGLFWAACRLSEAGIVADAIVDVLGPPAMRVGLDPREIERTIHSACRHSTAGRTSGAPPRTANAPTRSQPSVMRSCP